LVIGGANVEGAKLTDGVSRTNLKPSGFTSVFFILGDRTQGVELKNLIALTNERVPLNHAVGSNLRVSIDPYMGANTGISTHTHAAVEFCFGIDQSGGVDQTHGV
jgi:hypothetical protein